MYAAKNIHKRNPVKQKIATLLDISCAGKYCYRITGREKQDLCAMLVSKLK